MNKSMKVLGIIAEYNPFHNGHLYHMEQSKALSGADSVVCVMSGNFIQRGEPAIVDKWARAEMAVLAGADLVLELPVVYAMASAEFFAYGAVRILDSLGIADCLCFGSEAGELEPLEAASEVFLAEPEEYKAMLRKSLSKGISYPAAREEAYDNYMLEKREKSLGNKGYLYSSNNILGIEYLKALKKLDSKIKPVTVRRIGNEYNSEAVAGPISSATSIRKMIADTDIPGKSAGQAEPIFNEDAQLKLEDMLPPCSIKILQREFSLGRGPIFSTDFQAVLISTLRRMSAEDIKKLPYIAEGLENRFKKAAGEAGTLEELLVAVTTRRYTRTRIQRSIFSMLTGMTADEFNIFNRYGGPQYIRVLAFNAKGRLLLKEAGKTASLPIITKSADFKNSCNPLLSRMLAIEAASTDQYVLAFDSPEGRKGGQEFTHNIIFGNAGSPR